MRRSGSSKGCREKKGTSDMEKEKKLIVIIGSDGVGKSTAARSFLERYSRNGWNGQRMNVAIG